MQAVVNPPEVDRLAGSRAAVAARRARAEVKRQVSSGERSASEVLSAAARDGAQPEATMRVSELIASIPWLGPTRTAKIMQELRISPSKRLGGLGVHQYQRLHEFLVRRQAPRRLPEPDAPRSRLVVLAGPTAVGKGTVAAHIREHYPDVLLSVSATTRPPRPGEVDGVHYYFLSDEQFDRMVEAGQFLEWAQVHNAYRYGTPRQPIEAALAGGRSVLLEIDIQGARQVRQAFPEARLVFLLPPTWEELVRRLEGRGTEDEEERTRRLDTAQTELAAQEEFDAAVVNTRVEDAAREVVSLMSV
ncbi:guanylate kinase [Amnibacterium sp. CER49]|uniref:guanylate kinase n=1 Tax=Amnibacterium sp. CER49 TaxID=3039161 RepID=UPI002449CA35|nr:guanylate kinase [Amnibacterium sp. CER49]MDH2444338.1 guanylate kinase [Amnibacterium sp. CER49]